MQLVGFSVSKYRSIIKAHRLPMDGTTVLIGRNNEGKSNLLSGLAAAMSVVNRLADGRFVGARVQMGRRVSEFYDWERDFPISLQAKRPDGESVFRLEFQLSSEERAAFKEEVGSTLNEVLPIEIKLGNSQPSFRVVKSGRGASPLNKKREKVARFIGRRVDFVYIPAVRTASRALSVVQEMVDHELRGLQRTTEYEDAVKRLADLQKPIMEAMSLRIEDMLREFLPSIQGVSVQIAEIETYRALRRSISIIVDDGTATSLDMKGDGVQSLAAIGLLRGDGFEGKDLILALEEPESHLHPDAIHRLRKVVQELSNQHQIVISTHCPAFVDRTDVRSNIVVADGRATPARSIAAIRELIGVRASDNLRSAEVVLVVEGESDRRIVEAVVRASSPQLDRAFESHSIAVESLGGGAKVVYKLTELHNTLCRVHCFLDNDEAGRTAVQKAVDAEVLSHDGYHLATVPGKKDSVMEDLIRSDIYAPAMKERFGVELSHSSFRTKKKWGTRIGETFKAQGKLWDAATENEVKKLVADAVVEDPRSALGPQAEVFHGLLVRLEELVAGGGS